MLPLHHVLSVQHALIQKMLCLRVAYLMLLGSLFGMLRSSTKECMCFQLFSSCQIGMRNIKAAARSAFSDLQMRQAP